MTQSKKAMLPGRSKDFGTYNGGKSGSGVYQTIINQQPPHQVFISAFLGHCGIIRNKREAMVNIGFDLDPDVVSAWHANTPDELDDRFFFFVADAFEYLPCLLRRGKIGDETLLYCDPPYLMSTRSGGPRYKHELTDTQHIQLLSLLKTLPCMVQLSGYPSEMYDRELSGWRKIEFDAMTRQGVKRECLWMNYPEPKTLHTVWYAGGNYRERERIKRKASRWVGKFLAMSAAEQQFIIEQLLAANGYASKNNDAAATLFFGWDAGDPRGDFSADAAGNIAAASDVVPQP